MKKPEVNIIEETIIKSFGNMTVAAESLGCTRKTLYSWVDEHDLNGAIQEGRNRILDLAENKIAQKIKEGDTSCLIFFLKTQGRDRGYVEKTEIDHTTKGKEINISPIEWVKNGSQD